MLALVLGLLHLLLAPHSGTDAAAQLERAAFASAAPLTPVDLSWFSGNTYPYAYSLLAPGVMALVGVGACALLASVAASTLFARLLKHTERPLAGALLGAVFFSADIASGRTTFALGAMTALAALDVLPHRRRAVLLTVLTALLSPVAAVFLGLAAAVFVLHGRAAGWLIGLAAAVPVGVLAVLFPSAGVQPFPPGSAWPAVVAGLLVAALTDAALLRTGALLYTGAVVVLAFTSDPFGSNVLRLALLLAAPLVVATARRRRLVLLVVAVGLIQWQVRPTLADLRAPAPPETRSLQRVLARLEVRRVEVVPLRDHGEAATVAPAVPIARGWNRQTDYAENRLFYDGHLTAEEFVRWLQDHAVDTVAFAPHAALDRGGRREAALLASPVPGLQPVFSNATWSVWRVQDAVPIATPPSRVLASGPTRLVIAADRPETSRIAVRWSRWLTVSGPACIAQEGDRVMIRFRTAGTAVLGSGLIPMGHCAR